MHFNSPHLLLLPLAVDVVDGRGRPAVVLLLGVVPPSPPTAAAALPLTVGAAAVPVVAAGRVMGPAAADSARRPVDGERRVEELLAVPVVGGGRGWKRTAEGSKMVRAVMVGNASDFMDASSEFPGRILTFHIATKPRQKYFWLGWAGPALYYCPSQL